MEKGQTGKLIYSSNNINTQICHPHTSHENHFALLSVDVQCTGWYKSTLRDAKHALISLTFTVALRLNK